MSYTFEFAHPRCGIGWSTPSGVQQTTNDWPALAAEVSSLPVASGVEALLMFCRLFTARLEGALHPGKTGGK